MDVKQSSPQVTDSALRLPGEPPRLPADVVERFPSLSTWMDEQRRFWSQNHNAMQDFARSVLDVTEIAGVLVVDPNAASLYIKSGRGAGAYADPDTPFFVDRGGYFSLKNKLTWNPETNVLTVKGTIVATAGEIGGFIIAADNIRDVANSFGLSSVVTAGDDVRFWAGDTFANRATAPFRVYESGALVASNATISGSITATSGSIGGFNIGADYIRDAANSMGLASTVTGGDDVRFWAGDTFANRATAPFRVTEGGALTATSGAIGGFSIGADYLRDTGNSFGLASTVTGADDVRFWAGNTFANRAIAPIRITEGGVLYATGVSGNVTLANGFISLTDTGYASSLAAQTGLIMGAPVGTILFAVLRGTDTNNRLTINTDGVLLWGSGAAAGDTNLYRVSANRLATDDSLLVSINLDVSGSTVLQGALTVNSSVTATSFAGSGASVTSINATNISSGTLDNARLPSAISVTSLTASGEIRGATARFGAFTAIADTPVIGWVDMTDNGGTARRLAIV